MALSPPDLRRGGKKPAGLGRIDLYGIRIVWRMSKTQVKSPIAGRLRGPIGPPGKHGKLLAFGWTTE
jgi:hypothetical protein